MNWVDCVLAQGEILLLFEKITDEEVLLRISGPVIYGGGGPGHYPLLEKKYSVVDGRVQQAAESDPWRLKWRGDRLSVFLFGKRRSFGRKGK
jgi:hypothetical protein